MERVLIRDPIGCCVGGGAVGNLIPLLCLWPRGIQFLFGDFIKGHLNFVPPSNYVCINSTFVLLLEFLPWHNEDNNKAADDNCPMSQEDTSLQQQSQLMLLLMKWAKGRRRNLCCVVNKIMPLSLIIIVSCCAWLANWMDLDGILAHWWYD